MLDYLALAQNEVKQVTLEFPHAIAFLSAELFLLLTRRATLIALLKKKAQRNEQEKLDIKVLLLEAILFVPASIFLFYILLFPLMRDKLLEWFRHILICHAAAGIMAFVFPYSALSRFMKDIVYDFFRQFGMTVVKLSQEDKVESKQEARLGEDDG
jgi:hypothetical protein